MNEVKIENNSTDATYNTNDIVSIITNANTSNSNQIEPNEFFKIIKSSIKVVDQEKFNKEIDIISNQIVKTDKAGQIEYLNDLKQNYLNIYREIKFLRFCIWHITI